MTGPSARLRAFRGLRKSLRKRNTSTELRQMAACVEAAGEAIVRTDIDGVIEYVNPAFSRMTGYAPEEVIGREPSLLAFGSTPPEYYEELWRTIRSGEPWSGTFENRRKDGTLYVSNATITPMFDPEDRACGFVVVQSDATESVRMREQLETVSAELERSNNELEHFEYVASHDLQEPLRMVTSYLQLLVRRYEGRLGADADEFIRYATDGAKRMSGMIHALVDYSRTGRSFASTPGADCESALDEAIESLEVAVRDDAQISCDRPMPTVCGDAAQLMRLFHNLIENALRFRSESTPVVHVSVAPARSMSLGMWEFRVSDNGIGIDPRHADRVFEVFGRLHTRDEYEGSGIGLSICQRIVHNHGGAIHVESDPGGGCVFVFTLPADAADKD